MNTSRTFSKYVFSQRGRKHPKIIVSSWLIVAEITPGPTLITVRHCSHLVSLTNVLKIALNQEETEERFSQVNIGISYNPNTYPNKYEVPGTFTSCFLPDKNGKYNTLLLKCGDEIYLFSAIENEGKTLWMEFT